MSLLDFRRKRSKQPTAAQANSVRVLSLDEFLRAELLPLRIPTKLTARSDDRDRSPHPFFTGGVFVSRSVTMGQ